MPLVLSGATRFSWYQSGLYLRGREPDGRLSGSLLTGKKYREFMTASGSQICAEWSET
jgi:hypothetical protein